MNIEKIENGYLFNGEEHILTLDPVIISEDQADVFTNKGVILFDTNITIDGKSFKNISDLITYLKK